MPQTPSIGSACVVLYTLAKLVTNATHQHPSRQQLPHQNHNLRVLLLNYQLARLVIVIMMGMS
eukprot:XP_001707430.1 Hypothetical protein GL50803_9186 [Giardia lamblia ATCC 50803]